ncbi:hypothetical protein ACOME3_008016 [Neoechinorhynchus agilis]
MRSKIVFTKNSDSINESSIELEASCIQKAASLTECIDRLVNALPAFKTPNEEELYCWLEKFSLTRYYEVLCSIGADHLDQISKLDDLHLNLLMASIEMTCKPFHVKRFQDLISDYRTRPPDEIPKETQRNPRKSMWDRRATRILEVESQLEALTNERDQHDQSFEETKKHLTDELIYLKRLIRKHEQRMSRKVPRD